MFPRGGAISNILSLTWSDMHIYIVKDGGRQELISPHLMKRSTYSSFVDVRKALYELRFNNSPFYKMAAVNTNVVHTYQMHHSELSCLC